MPDTPETLGKHSHFAQAVGNARLLDGPSFGHMRVLLDVETQTRRAFYAIHGEHAVPWPGRHRIETVTHVSAHSVRYKIAQAQGLVM